MRRLLPLLLALGMTISLCACGVKTPEPPVPDVTAIPTATPEPTPAPTATPEPTPAPTATPAVVTPTPEPRWVRGEERVDYFVFTGDAPGADALTVWLLGEGRELLAAFAADESGEGMFLPAGGLTRENETVPRAAEDTRDILLAADARLADCGLLEALIPVFAYTYGYNVEILTGSGEALSALAREADLAILAEEEALPLRQEGVFRTYWSFASTEYYKEGTPVQ